MNDTKIDLQRFHEDGKFFDSHYAELLEQYPEQWVAIYHKEVVGTDTNFEQLVANLKSRGLPPSKIVIEKVTSHDEVWILPIQ